MATTPSLKVVKSFTYKGVARLWSNRYHFNGGTPADTTHWTTLSDAVVTAEKACLINTPPVTIVETLGYAAGSDVPVFSKTYSTAGTYNSVGVTPAPGDAAALVRYATTARTSKNHPVYLFNYYHGITQASSSTPDTFSAAQLSAMQTYANHWVTGFSDGSINAVRAGPNGATATAALVESFITHRDFS